MKKLTVLLSILVLALGILAAGCGGGDKKADDKKAAAPAPAAKEELIVGTEPSFAPFEFPEKDSKEFTGFDMDLIRAIAKEMGYKKCTIRNMGFDAPQASALRKNGNSRLFSRSPITSPVWLLWYARK